MYSKFVVKVPFKALFEDVFTNSKEQKNFIAGEVIEGRLDNISGNDYFVTSDGLGSIINANYLEKLPS